MGQNIEYNVLLDSIKKSIKNSFALAVGMSEFAFSLLVWMYECIPLVFRPSIFYAKRVDKRNIYMLNWIVDGHPKWKDLAERVFDNEYVCCNCCIFYNYCECYKCTYIYYVLFFLCHSCNSLNSRPCFLKKISWNKTRSMKGKLPRKQKKDLEKKNARDKLSIIMASNETLN